MSIGLSVLGIIILLGVTLDIWITTLTVGGGRPITSRFSAQLWTIALKIYRHRPNHRTDYYCYYYCFERSRNFICYS
ncbi:MAG: hypothetical protein AAFO04_16725 [Cyanobacteria bacterium J06592_8]